MAKSSQNGRSHNGDSHALLENAMATLINTQAAFVSSMAETNRQNAETFARMDATFTAIFRELDKHSRMLERLPEAVREKIGFKA